MTTNRTHTHRAEKTVDRPFFGPVRQPENRAAHGCICEVATCKCGATRRTNVNGQHIERGPWVEDENDGADAQAAEEWERHAATAEYCASTAEYERHAREKRVDRSTVVVD